MELFATNKKIQDLRDSIQERDSKHMELYKNTLEEKTGLLQRQVKETVESQNVLQEQFRRDVLAREKTLTVLENRVSKVENFHTEISQTHRLEVQQVHSKVCEILNVFNQQRNVFENHKAITDQRLSGLDTAVSEGTSALELRSAKLEDVLSKVAQQRMLLENHKEYTESSLNALSTGISDASDVQHQGLSACRAELYTEMEHLLKNEGLARETLEKTIAQYMHDARWRNRNVESMLLSIVEQLKEKGILHRALPAMTASPQVLPLHQLPETHCIFDENETPAISPEPSEARGNQSSRVGSPSGTPHAPQPPPELRGRLSSRESPSGTPRAPQPPLISRGNLSSRLGSPARTSEPTMPRGNLTSRVGSPTRATEAPVSRGRGGSLPGAPVAPVASPPGASPSGTPHAPQPPVVFTEDVMIRVSPGIDASSRTPVKGSPRSPFSTKNRNLMSPPSGGRPNHPLDPHRP